ncbi:MinD/ParA family protein [Desulfurivibrio alkaliphilus]|uniref:Cobyrinic acid ac-diamide synthase n=1 Tax=Desulfurivibrio alkaliphilus (strain DSM 19089 / UNIQEM U267 / AHT2) TaxID=589865 RepID=D6Z052_DESAT|nr:MinD/ParA family protein [Desulfurivibrio alkaliphilus]ADH87085.1 Cobyrinic acid ac-diamide synthase [Desulfurivibrio alkaliphilus AHT 2]
MNRTIAITSGKGGVGKTNLTVNLAIHLAELGYRPCLFDADLGTANINIMLGINPEHDIGDVIRGEKTIQDIIIHDSSGVNIIPGSSGVEEMANLEAEHLDTLVKSFAALGRYDFFLFDTSAGISRSVVAFCLAASEVVLVITSEPTSMTDAYSLLKVLTRNKYGGRVRVVVNRCPDVASAKGVFKKFRMAVDKYLGVPLEPLGLVFQDEVVPRALQQQKSFMKLYPQSGAASCIRSLTQRLTNESAEKTAPEDMTVFWNNCFKYFNMPLDIPGKRQEQRGQESVPPPEPAVVAPVMEAAEETPAVPPPVAPSAAGESSATGEPGETGEPRQATNPQDPLQAFMPFIPIVQQLAGNLGQVSSELSRIREALGANGKNPGPAHSGDHNRPSTPAKDRQVYVLDLQAYAAGSNRSKES